MITAATAQPSGSGAAQVAGDPESLPTVSVVLATRGRPTLVKEVVRAVLSDPATLEVVAVIDGLDRDTEAVLGAIRSQRTPVEVLSTHHVGQLAALDLGVRRAAGEVVLLLDDDVVPKPGMVSGHARVHAQRSGVVVMGAMPVRLPDDGRAPAGTVLYAREYDAVVRDLLQGRQDTLDRLWTGNLSLRRTDCLAVGLRSPEFPASYHADRELGFRLRRAGLVGVFDPSLGAEHLHRRADRAFLRDAQRAGAGRALLASLHPDADVEASPRQMTAALPRALRGLVRAVGVSPGAERVALALMAAGRLGGQHGKLVSAKLARRLMLCHGAVHGEPIA